MTPSPLKRLLLKMFMLSAASAMLMLLLSEPRHSSTSLAALYSILPSSLSVLMLLSSSTSEPLSMLSLSLMTPVSHFAAATTSATRIFPSLSESIIARVWASICRPFTGQLRTVHFFWSSSSRWAISSPLLRLTLTTPPTEQ